jgi:DNA topoisomerase I
VPRLRRSDCASPGIRRRRRGRGFEFIDPDGDRVGDPEVLERIAQLAIPPAWRDAWVCLDPQGHLQATGIDAAGRKQYLYHDHWRAHRDRLKFGAMTSFGRALPRLRRRVARDLRGEDLARQRVLACVVRLLDLGFFRVGSDDYAERNESYGLTTMLKRHVSVRDGALLFDYTAKSGVRRVQEIRDERALEIVTSLKSRRGGGAQLFVHRRNGGWADIHSEDVNEYVKQASGGQFTAKDFRTWNATVLAAVALAINSDGASTSAARERVVRDAVRTVAAYLGNTPAVCRASYIDPRVIDRYHSGATISKALEGAGDGPDLDDGRTRARVEEAVLEMLE